MWGKIWKTLVALIIVSWLSVYLIYRPKYTGTFHLEKLNKTVKVTRESDTGIAHIEAPDLRSALYG
jgi:acyl-homoserine lactone acylase PvdQ